jgi:hypothetical protein
MRELNPYPIASIIADAFVDAFVKYLKDQPSRLPECEGKQGVYHVVKPTFGKFVTRNEGFQSDLLDLKRLIQGYADREKVDRPLNVLLAAGPGSGKSFLVKQFATEVSACQELSFKEIFVPAYGSVDELMNAVREIAASEYENEDENPEGCLPFVFFDEVDARLNNRHIFANLLAPMWDGAVHTTAGISDLKRAVFFFAGSEQFPSVSDQGLKSLTRFEKGVIPYRAYRNMWLQEMEQRVDEDARQQEVAKLRDFLDRVDYYLCIPPVHLALLGAHLPEEQLDVVYLMIRKHFPEVQCVEQAAAVVLAGELSDSVSRRSAERCVFNSTPTGNTLTLEDLPKSVRELYAGNGDVNNGKDKYIHFTMEPAAKQANEG